MFCELGIVANIQEIFNAVYHDSTVASVYIIWFN